MKILIVGSGGHSKVVADILDAAEHLTPIGFLSPDVSIADELPLPILGSDEDLPDIEHDGLVVAVGNNATRERLFEQFTSAGETLVSAVHPTAVISPEAVIGPGCMICAGVVVNPGAVIGANTILNTGCTVDHHCVIGDHVHIAPGVNLAGNVTVGEGAFLGIGSCAIQGVAIGEWATVGAGGAVIEDVPAHTTVVGVPARAK